VRSKQLRGWGLIEIDLKVTLFDGLALSGENGVFYRPAVLPLPALLRKLLWLFF
jgi:hypothetical protein